MTDAAALDLLVATFHAGTKARTPELLGAIDTFLSALEAGRLRAAAPDGNGGWQVNAGVKQSILVCFRLGDLVESGAAGGLQFIDKDTMPMQSAGFAERGIRIVPGGSSIRRGAFLGRSVTCMPPMYVNVGAFIDDGTMVDSHALVGSCAQIGKGVHLSAGCQIGGVLEPIGNRPVIVEDGALVGGNTGIYEGTLVRRGAVIGAGVVLTASTPVFDLVHDRILRSGDGQPLEIPENAVVVPGSRAIGSSDFARQHGLQIQTPLIVKYRDASTDLRTALEGSLR
jgi:2,3,4,5-tetrahydropyridine-2-carboxylate N-succinyltransferase